MQVLLEYRGIQLVAAEAAAHEEGTAAAQDTADDRHVQVDASGDMRRSQTVVYQQIGQQQVIDMAAVAGDVDDLLAPRDILHVGQIIDLDTVVQFVPEPGQHHFQKADDGVGEVRGYLVGIARRAVAGPLDADVLLRRFLFNGSAHQRTVHQSLEQGVAVG